MTAHRPSRARLLWLILVCALLGTLLSTITAAVGSYLYLNTDGPTQWVSYDMATDPPPPSPLQWLWPPPSEIIPGLTGTKSMFGFREESIYSQSDPRLNRPAGWYSQMRLTAGWPIAMTEHRSQANSSPTRRGWLQWTSDPFSCLVVIPLKGIGTMNSVYIPVRPRVPGALLNVAFWAAVCFATAQLAGWVRRRRRPPGSCRSCGYLVHDLPTCPECGSKSTTT